MDDAEPDLYLIQPRSMGWREMHLNVLKRGQPLLHYDGCMGAVVVHYQVKLPSWRCPPYIYLVEESEEVRRLLPLGRLSIYLPVMNTQRSEEIDYPVSLIIEVGPFRRAQLPRLRRMKPLQRLDGGLLIHAYHKAVLWWVDVQAAHFKLLLLEFRVIREEPHPVLVWLKIKTAEDLMHTALLHPCT